MSDPPAAKVLVVGDVEGQFAAFSKKLTTLNAKAGPFVAVFVVGEFFGSNPTDNWEFLHGTDPRFRLPCSVYILGSSYPNGLALFEDRTALDAVRNLTYLGRRGMVTLASGSSVVLFILQNLARGIPIPVLSQRLGLVCKC